MTVYKIAGRVSFGEIRGVEQMTITRSRGIQPATVQMVVPYLPVMPVGATPLALSDGINAVYFNDCILQSVDADYSEGERYVVTLLDFRWKWKFGEISGDYNTIRADSIVAKTKKKPRELAILCLQAMGVKKYNVEAMPNDTYPEITWNLDVPAVALETLCSNLGCVICPQLDGSVLIARQGVGKTLPRIVGSQVNATIKADPAPDVIHVSGAPTVWEISLELSEPVGVQDDGTIVPIDKLLYKPKGGWGNEDPRTFANVAIDKRKLAFESVWKWFRFKFPIDLPELPFKITESGQLYFEENLVEKQKLLGIESRKPRVVYGRFYDLKDSLAMNVPVFSHDYDTKTYTATQIKKRLVYDGGFEIDQDNVIIKFSDAIFVYDFEDEKVKYKIPNVRVRVAVSVKDPKTGVRYREVYKQPTGRRNGSQPMWIRKDEVRREIEVDPKTSKIKETGTTKKDNVAEVKKKLKAYAGFELSKLALVSPAQGTYQGFPLINLDGTIEQVTYSITGEGFAETVASYGTEHSFVVPSFEERRRFAKLNATLAEQQSKMNSKPDGKTQR